MVYYFIHSPLSLPSPPLSFLCLSSPHFPLFPLPPLPSPFFSLPSFRVEVVFEAQGEVSWVVPTTMATKEVVLFDTTSAHLNKGDLVFMGGAEGRSLTFKVCELHTV